MMRWLIGSSMKFRLLVVTVAAGLLVYGVLQLDNMRRDILPEFQQTTVEVQTEALGLSAEEVEQLITVPLEQDLLVGIAFLDEIESVSLPGLSSVVMTFEPGTDLLDARQVVAERLTQAVAAAGLPAVAKPPQMLQPLSSTSRVAMVKLASSELTPIEMSVLARWIIAPRLLGVEGVANVAIWGFKDRQLQVLVDPERLAESGVTLNQVIRTTGNALEVSPLTFLEASSPGTGGFIDTLSQRLHIFHQQAISTPEELAQVPLEGQGGGASERGELVLGDVTEVVEDHQPLIGDAQCTDGECLLLVIEKFPGANTPEVTSGVDAALDAMAPGLPGLEIDTGIYRPAAFIDESFDSLGRAMAVGGILALLALGALFFSWRRALVSVMAILVSLAAAWLVLYLARVTVNTMILAGLVTALIVLIDDGVSDVDNAARSLREHASDKGGTPKWRVLVDSSMEMRKSLLYATVMIAALLLPSLFMTQTAGAFLPPMATAYVVAILSSLVVALTLTPALTVLLLAGAEPSPDSPVVRWMQRGYERLAPRIVPHPGPAYAVFGGLVLVGLVTLPFLDRELRPSLLERDILIHLNAPPGTSLPRMDEITARALEGVRSVPGVANSGAHVGRAIQSDQIVNVNSAEVWVNIDSSADYEEAVDSIEQLAAGLPEVSASVLTYSEQRITDLLGSDDKSIVVRIYGDDPAVLEATADEVRDVISEVEGVENPQVRPTADEPTIEVEPDITRAEAYGLSPGDIRRAATTLLSGLVVGNLFEEQKVFDVVVWGVPEIRQSESDVHGLLIDTPRGGLVPLGDVAEVRITPNPNVIYHESAQSYIDVVADASGGSVSSVAADVDDALEGVEFPLEYHAEVLGGFREQQAANARLLAVAVAVAIAVFLLLQAAFTSWRLAILSFLTLSAAIVGGLVAVLLTGGTLTLGSVAGFLAILSIAMRFTVVLLRRYQTLERDRGMPFGSELVVQGTRERLGPIVATAVVGAAALLPVLFAGTTAGMEIVRPMAVVLIGGLATTVVLTIVVLPAVYLRFGFVAEPDTSADELFVLNVPETDTVGDREG